MHPCIALLMRGRPGLRQGLGKKGEESVVLHPHPLFFTHHLPNFQQPMTLPKDIKTPVFQTFETEDGQPLQKLPVQICPETGHTCIFWQDVQNAFNGMDHVDGKRGGHTIRVMFMINQYGELYV